MRDDKIKSAFLFAFIEEIADEYTLAEQIKSAFLFAFIEEIADEYTLAESFDI
jgi:hypothetical protein